MIHQCDTREADIGSGRHDTCEPVGRPVVVPREAGQLQDELQAGARRRRRGFRLRGWCGGVIRDGDHVDAVPPFIPDRVQYGAHLS